MKQITKTILPPSLKIDAMAMASGRALYGADWSIAKMGHEPLVAMILHSQMAGIKITNLDISAALAIPGVRAILTYENSPTLFSPYINKVGIPLAVVAATNLNNAKSALKAIQFDYLELIECNTDNINVNCWTPMILERPCCTGYLDELGRCVLITANKDPFLVRRQVVTKLGLSIQQLRVINCRAGGNFGARESTVLETLVTALVLATRQPIQLELCQNEILYLSEEIDPNRAQRQAIQTASLELDILATKTERELLTCFLEKNTSSLNSYLKNAIQLCYQQGADNIAWSTKRNRHYKQGRFIHGVGAAIICLELNTLTAAWSKATLLQNEDGSCQLLSGLADDGSGSDTLLAQIAAREYSCRPEQVVVYSGDTDLTIDPHLTDSSNITTVPACAAHFAEVAIDSETGEIKVVNYALVAACSAIGNQSIAYNQLNGGIMWALANCLALGLPSDRNGKNTNLAITEQTIYSIADKPHISTIIQSLDQPITNEIVGDLTNLGSFGVAPAIASAIYDAIGIRLLTTPFTAEQIFMARKENRKEHERNS